MAASKGRRHIRTMTDISAQHPQTVSPATRKVMQANKRRDTEPELKVRRWLHARGYRFRVDRAGLPGRPDVVLPKHRLAVFVHGCYWHGHGCGKASKPKTNPEFWRDKFARNAARHERDAGRLSELGWRVEVVWECDLRDMDRAMAPVMALLRPSEAQEPPPAPETAPRTGWLRAAVLRLLGWVRGKAANEGPRSNP